MRNLGPAGGNAGGAKYNLNTYLRERGDANIRSVTDLIDKANFWDDPVIENRKENLQRADSATTLAGPGTLQNRFAVQTIVLQTFAELRLDAVVYPTGNIPPAIITSPTDCGDDTCGISSGPATASAIRSRRSLIRSLSNGVVPINSS